MQIQCNLRKHLYLISVANWFEVGYVCDAGSYGGYPLHHAAKRGLDKTVLLLLSRGGTLPLSEYSKKSADENIVSFILIRSHVRCCSGAADPLALNDDSLTPLEMARNRGHVAVVRMIEVLFYCISCY